MMPLLAVVGCGAPTECVPEAECRGEFLGPPSDVEFEGEVRVGEVDGREYCLVHDTPAEWSRDNLPCWDRERAPYWEEFLDQIGFGDPDASYAFVTTDAEGTVARSTVSLCTTDFVLHLRPESVGVYTFYTAVNGALTYLRLTPEGGFTTPYSCSGDLVGEVWWGEADRIERIRVDGPGEPGSPYECVEREESYFERPPETERCGSG